MSSWSKLRTKLFLIALGAFVVPVLASAQVFNQNQVIIAPYGGPGFIVSTTTGGGGKLQATTTPYFSNFYAGTGHISNLFVTSCSGCGDGTFSTTSAAYFITSTTTLPSITTLANLTTVKTTLSGLLKATAGLLSVATPGTDYQIPITLTTTGSSGAATFNPGTGALNIPVYSFTNTIGYPFTIATNFGATNQATTGVLWLQNGVNASSTSNFNTISVLTSTTTNASTTNISGRTLAYGGTGTTSIDSSGTLKIQNLTGLALTTSGTVSAYGGASCPAQFIQSLTASGVPTCAGSTTDSSFSTTSADYWITSTSSLPSITTLANLGTVKTTLTGNLQVNTGVLYTVATSSVSAGSGISFMGTPGALLGGTALTINNLIGYPFTPGTFGTLSVSATTSALYPAGLVTGTSTIGSLNASSSLVLPFITSTQCLHTINGVVSGTGSDCGSGSGNSFGKTWEIDAAGQLAPTTTLAVSIPKWLSINDQTLAYASTTNGVTLFGLSAGGNVSTTSSVNTGLTAVGYQALSVNGTGGLNNTAVGYQALNANTTGDDNVAIGYKAGSTNSLSGRNVILGANSGPLDGSGNIVVGAYIQPPSTNGQISIGNVLFGTNSYNGSTLSYAPAVLGSIGIGTSSPTATFALQANNGATNTTLFTIASSTQLATTTLFSVSNIGSTTMGNFGSCSGNNALNTDVKGTIVCGAVNSTGGGSSYPFTPSTFGTLSVSATTTALQAYAGLISATSTIGDLNASSSLTLPFLGGNGSRFVTVTNTGSVSSIALPLTYANGGGNNIQNVTGNLAYYGGTSLQNVATSSPIAGAGVGLSGTGSVVGGSLTISNLIGFPFTPTTAFGSAANATGTLIGFTAGIYSTASSTIGGGGTATGLTISGNATTTNNMAILGSLAIGTTTGDLPTNTGNLLLYNTNVSGASPALVIGGNTGGDTDYWIGRQNNNDNVANQDYLQVGVGLIPGTNPFITWDGNRGVEGIGTTSPAFLLNLATSTKPQLALSDASATSNQWTFRNINGNLYIATSSPTTFATSTGQAAIQISPSTNGTQLGIATTSPWRTLSVNGTVAFQNLSTGTAGSPVCINTSGEVVSSGGTTCATSSIKTKHDVQALSTDEALADIMALKPVAFTFNESGDRRVGFIAEEVNKIDPRLVDLAQVDTTFPDASGTIYKGDPISVEYANITALLVKAVQNIVSRLSGDEKKINAMQKQIDTLNARLDALEK